MGMQRQRASRLRQLAAQITPEKAGRQFACAADAATAPCRSPLCLATACWVAGLPALGTVLYAPAAPQSLPPGRPLPGLLVETAELAPLLHTRALGCASAITPDGPREWMECRDGSGRLLARLYLLPDTDYLAWDALYAGTGTPASVRAEAQAWRPATMRLLRFRLRRYAAGLQLLGADVVAPSPLVRELAARIARDGATLR